MPARCAVFTSAEHAHRSNGIAGDAWNVDGLFARVDALGTPLPDTLLDAGYDLTPACAIDNTSDDLWTAGGYSNTVSHFAAPSGSTPAQLLGSIDVSPYTATSSCGTNPGDVHDGCGAATSVALDRAGDIFVGTNSGTNTILEFSPSGALIDSFEVPVGPQGRTAETFESMWNIAPGRALVIPSGGAMSPTDLNIAAQGYIIFSIALTEGKMTVGQAKDALNQWLAQGDRAVVSPHLRFKVIGDQPRLSSTADRQSG